MKAYARGYYIRNDYYNGINYAFMLDVRASCSAGDEALADRILARRVRADVLIICDQLLQAAPGADSDEPFWIAATKVEALFGLGRRDEADRLKKEIVEKERLRLIKAGGDGTASQWKAATLSDQLKKLGELLPP